MTADWPFSVVRTVPSSKLSIALFRTHWDRRNGHNRDQAERANTRTLVSTNLHQVRAIQAIIAPTQTRLKRWETRRPRCVRDKRGNSRLGWRANEAEMLLYSPSSLLVLAAFASPRPTVIQLGTILARTQCTRSPTPLWQQGDAYTDARSRCGGQDQCVAIYCAPWRELGEDPLTE